MNLIHWDTDQCKGDIHVSMMMADESLIASFVMKLVISLLHTCTYMHSQFSTVSNLPLTFVPEDNLYTVIPCLYVFTFRYAQLKVN